MVAGPYGGGFISTGALLGVAYNTPVRGSPVAQPPPPRHPLGPRARQPSFSSCSRHGCSGPVTHLNMLSKTGQSSLKLYCRSWLAYIAALSGVTLDRNSM